MRGKRKNVLPFDFLQVISIELLVIMLLTSFMSCSSANDSPTPANVPYMPPITSPAYSPTPTPTIDETVTPTPQEPEVSISGNYIRMMKGKEILWSTNVAQGWPEDTAKLGTLLPESEFGITGLTYDKENDRIIAVGKSTDENYDLSRFAILDAENGNMDYDCNISGMQINDVVHINNYKGKDYAVAVGRTHMSVITHYSEQVNPRQVPFVPIFAIFEISPDGDVSGDNMIRGDEHDAYRSGDLAAQINPIVHGKGAVTEISSPAVGTDGSVTLPVIIDRYNQGSIGSFNLDFGSMLRLNPGEAYYGQ